MALSPESAEQQGSELVVDVDFDDTGDIAILDVDDAIAARVADGSVTLPSFPSILEDLGAATGAASVVAVVERDLGLVAAIVRLAESEGLGRVTTAEAVAHLGGKRLNKIALAQTLAKTALAPGPLFDVRRRLWRACLAGALVAEAIADDHGVAADVAFLAGLLHDFGRIIALALVEENVADARPGDVAWLDVVDRHHCDLGQMLAESWSLPQPIPAVIGGHHERLHSARIALLDVVHVVDDVVALKTRKLTLTLADVDALPLVASREQAALILRAVDKVPALAAAIAPPMRASTPPFAATTNAGPATRPATTSGATAATTAGAPGATTTGGATDAQVIGTIALEKSVRVQLQTAMLGQARIEGLVTTMVSRTALAVTSKQPLPKGWVTRLEIAGPRGPFTVWVSVVSAKQERGLHYAEAKPLALHAGADGWPAFVETLRAA